MVSARLSVGPYCFSDTDAGNISHLHGSLQISVRSHLIELSVVELLPLLDDTCLSCAVALLLRLAVVEIVDSFAKLLLFSVTSSFIIHERAYVLTLSVHLSVCYCFPFFSVTLVMNGDTLSKFSSRYIHSLNS